MLTAILGRQRVAVWTGRATHDALPVTAGFGGGFLPRWVVDHRATSMFACFGHCRLSIHRKASLERLSRRSSAQEAGRCPAAVASSRKNCSVQILVPHDSAGASQPLPACCHKTITCLAKMTE